MTMVRIGVVHAMRIWFGIKSFAQTVADLFCGKVGEVEMKEYIVQAIDPGTIDSFDARNATELVRCKDCKHGRIYYTTHVACDIIEHPSHDLEWFCADGERKET